MNKIGIQYLYWNEPNILHAADLTAAAGMDVFECGTTVVTGMTPEERKAFSRALRAKGLEITLNGGMPGADPCSPDPEIRRESIRLCCEAVQAAADVGSPVWGGIIYSKWLGMPEGSLTAQSRYEMWQRGVESMRQVMTVAEREGVDVCFEIVNRFEAYMATTSAQGVAFTNDIGSPRAKLLLDIFHMNIEEDSTVEAMRHAMVNGRFGHLHASESNRGMPGLRKTDMDWDGILGSLSEIGYEGIITMEPMVMMETPTSGKYRIWRDMLEDFSEAGLLAAAQKSTDFLRGKLK